MIQRPFSPALLLASERSVPEGRAAHLWCDQALIGCERLLALVELDVAATGVVAAQIATGGVVGRTINRTLSTRSWRWHCTEVQFDFEYIVSPWLAFVTHADARLEARYAIYGHVVTNDPAIRVTMINIVRVARDLCGLHVHAGAMIDVVEVAPERAVLDATRDTEIGLGARRRAGDPSAAGHEVARCLTWSRWWTCDESTKDSDCR